MNVDHLIPPTGTWVDNARPVTKSWIGTLDDTLAMARKLWPTLRPRWAWQTAPAADDANLVQRFTRPDAAPASWGASIPAWAVEAALIELARGPHSRTHATHAWFATRALVAMDDRYGRNGSASLYWWGRLVLWREARRELDWHQRRQPHWEGRGEDEPRPVEAARAAKGQRHRHQKRTRVAIAKRRRQLVCEEEDLRGQRRRRDANPTDRRRLERVGRRAIDTACAAGLMARDEFDHYIAGPALRGAHVMYRKELTRDGKLRVERVYSVWLDESAAPDLVRVARRLVLERKLSRKRRDSVRQLCRPRRGKRGEPTNTRRAQPSCSESKGGSCAPRAAKAGSGRQVCRHKQDPTDIRIRPHSTKSGPARPDSVVRVTHPYEHPAEERKDPACSSLE